MNPEKLTEFLAWRPPHVPNIIQHGILPKGQVLFLYGEYGTMKSWLVQDMAVSIAKGQPWLIYPTSQARVLMLNTELPKKEYQDRWTVGMQGRKLSNLTDIWLDTTTDLFLDTVGGIGDLLATVTQLSIDVVILDNLYSAVRGDLTKNTTADSLIKNCKVLSHRGISLVCVHHARQGLVSLGSGKQIFQGAFEMFGSSYLPNWADSIFITRHEDVPGLSDTITLTPQKYRLCSYKPLEATYRFSRQTTEFELVL